MADNEHKVVYRAVAKFGELYAEIAKANAALKTLRDEQVRTGSAARDIRQTSTQLDAEAVQAAQTRTREIAKVTQQAAAEQVATAQSTAQKLRAQQEQAAAQQLATAKATAEKLRAQEERDAAYRQRLAERSQKIFEDSERAHQERLVKQATAAAAKAAKAAEAARATATPATAPGPAPGSWQNVKTGRLVKNPSQVSIVRGDVRQIPTERQTQVEDLVREAYRKVHGDTLGETMGLADVRDDIGDKATRQEVDDALRRLAQRGPDDPLGARVGVAQDKRRLKKRDREAAVSIGAEPRYTLGFTQPLPTPVTPPVQVPEPTVPVVDPVKEQRRVAAARKKAEAKAAQALLDEEHAQALADADHERQQAIERAAKATEASRAEPSTPQIHPATQDDVDQAVKDAVVRLQAKRGDWVGLDRLRGDLGDRFSREQVDQAIRKVEQHPDFNVVPESNRKALTDTQRAASVRLGGQDKHLISYDGDDLAAQQEAARRRATAPAAAPADEADEYEQFEAHMAELHRKDLEKAKAKADAEAARSDQPPPPPPGPPVTPAAAVPEEPDEPGKRATDLRRARDAQELRARDHSAALKQYKKLLDDQAKLDQAARRQSVDAALKLQGTHPEQIAQAQQDAQRLDKERTRELERQAAVQAKRDQDHSRALKEVARTEQQEINAAHREALRIEQERSKEAARAEKEAVRAEKERLAGLKEEARLLEAQKKSISEAAAADQKRRRQSVDDALKLQGTHPEQIAAAHGDALQIEKDRAAEADRAERERAKEAERAAVVQVQRDRDHARALRDIDKAAQAAQDKRDADHARAAREYSRVLKVQQDEAQRAQGTHPDQVLAAHREALQIEKEITHEAQRTAAVQARRDADHFRAAREYERVLKVQQDEAQRAQGIHPDQIKAAQTEALQIEKDATREAQRTATVQAKRDADHFRAAREYERVLKGQQDDALRAQGIHPDQIKAAQTEAVQINNARTREAAKAAKEIQRLRDKDHAEALVQIRRESDERARLLKARRSGKARSYSNAAAAGANLFRRRANRADYGDDRSRDLSGAFSSFTDVLPKTGDNMTRMQRIIAAVTVLIIALVPVVASLAAALLALTAAAAAGAAAVGIFAAVAVGQITALKKAIDDAVKSGKPLAESYQVVANSLYGLQAAYRQLLVATRAPVFAVFVDAMNLVTQLLPRFIPLIEATSLALRQMLNQIAGAVQSGTFSDFLDFIGIEGPQAIVDFTRILLTFGQGFAELLMAVEPFIQFFVQGLQRMASSFEAWAASLSGSDRFESFMNYAVEVGPKVLRIFYDIVGALVNLATGLAPVGYALLVVVQGLSNLISALPPGFFTFVVGGFIAVWAAIRVLLGIGAVVRLLGLLRNAFIAFGVLTRIQALFIGFSMVINRMVTAMGVAEGAAGGLRAALVALSAAGVITLVIAAVALLANSIGKLSNANTDAAASAKKHADAVMGLAQALRATNGAVTDEILAGQIDTFAQTDTTKGRDLSAREIPFFGGDKNGRDVTYSTLQEAKKAGVSGTDLAAGSVGDDEARKRVQAQLDEYAKQAQVNTSFFTSKEDRQAKFDEAARAKAAADAYREAAVSGEELVDAQNDLASGSSKVTDALRDESIMTGTLTEKRKALGAQTQAQTDLTGAFDALTAQKKAVQDLADAQQAQKDTAVDVARANEDAIRKVADAQKAATRADRDAVRAQEDLTQARIDATQKIVDQQRVLRDIPLDEKEADLAVKRARRARGTARGLDRQQANLDYQRAINSRNDLYADAPQKAADAQKIINAGVEGNRTVQDAETDLTDAYTNQKTSVDNLKRAIEDKDRTLRGGDKDNRDAAQNVKDLGKQADAAQSNVQTLASNLGLTVDQLGQLQGKYTDLQKLGQVNIDKIDGAASAVEKLNSVAVALEALRLLAASPSMTIDAAYAQARQNLIAAGLISDDITGFQNPKAGTGGGRGSFAAGGPVQGAGTATSDSIVANLSNGEHVWTAAEVIAVGGHTMVQAIRDAALGRKVAASKPTYADRYAAELFKVAGIYGRSNQSTFDPSSMYASLGRLATAKPVPVPAGTAKGVASTATRGDFSVGDVTINNPVREPSGASLYRTVRRFKHEHEG